MSKTVIIESEILNCSLKIRKRGDRFTGLLFCETLGWGTGISKTLKGAINEQRKDVIHQLKILDKTNDRSKKGLRYILSELNKLYEHKHQLELF
jgi:hypothetical protein